MPFTITADERGVVFAANGAYVYLPDDDPIFEPVAVELNGFTGRAVEAETVMKAEALPDHLRGHASKALLSTTRTAVEAARERAREFAVADQRAMTPPKSLDTSNAAEIRAIARSLDRSGKTAFVIFGFRVCHPLGLRRLLLVLVLVVDLFEIGVDNIIV